MQNTLLQTYLNKQFIKTADEGNIENLKKAAKEIAKKLEKKKALIIHYTLVAIDPLINENDPVVTEVEKIIISKWSAFKNSVTQTQDKPTTYIRVVILEALSQLAQEEDHAGIIWHSSRDVISYYNTSSEGALLGEFLLSIGNKIEASSKNYWSITNPGATRFDGASISIAPAKILEVNQEKLTNHLKAAAVHSGWSAQAGGGENPSYTHQSDWKWAKFFAETAAEGLAEEFNSALASQSKVINSVSTSLQKELNNYFSQLQPFFEQISANLIQGVVANNKRSELLWWKESLLSTSLAKSYRSLEPISAAITMAVDLANIVDPIYPLSVDFFLKEALRDIYGNLIDTTEDLENWIEKALRQSDEVSNLLQALVNDAEGRKPLGTALANKLTAKSSADVFIETGIDKKNKISLADFAIWLFHDLQAAKISSTK